MSSSLVATGDVLGDRYVLKKTETATPLGSVWLARDRVLDRAVFVQILSPELAADASARKQFLRSAARAAQVTHPSLAQVYDIGDDPPFAVFEFAGGGTLADRVRGGAMRPTEAARAGLALARGIEALHDRSSWHGALSPSSILIDGEGRAKILALGSAEVAPQAARAEQPAGYRPPEADATPADSDRFALAAMIFHMLTGKPPTIEAQRAPRRGMPPEIDSMLRRALSADPSNRPSLDEIVGALAPSARVMPTEARPQRRMRSSEFGWLIPVVLILAAAGLVVTFGVRFVQDLADGDEATRPSPSPTVARPLEAAAVRDFDPEGNGEEHPEQAGRAIDGDPLTAWTTVGYRSSNPGDKTGVGLLFDLGTTEAVGRLRVQTTLPGWRAEVRVATTEPRSLADTRRVADFVAATDTRVPLPSGTRGRYVLVWITNFADDEGESDFPFRATVGEVQFFSR
ncbi:MAG TPA: protein kinase [Actinomycetota bacterium]|nr:protein kinase [Actinomycetota bacterium]